MTGQTVEVDTILVKGTQTGTVRSVGLAVNRTATTRKSIKTGCA